MPQRITIKITPRSKENKIVGLKNGILRVRIAAPPVEGKANRALVAFLADAWGVSKSSIRIVRGETSREKVLEVPDGIPLQKGMI
ncbi:MAG: YggU family protein [Parcubacteria group bacterium]|nr:YggU family protein [Parcubacteria group bacterium]